MIFMAVGGTHPLPVFPREFTRIARPPCNADLVTHVRLFLRMCVAAETWRDQVAKFLEEVVQVKAEEAKTRAVVVGNSLGGYTALSVAAHYPSLTAGCAVLNGAGA